MRFFILFALFFATFSPVNADNERTLFSTDINSQDEYGHTHLHLAVDRGELGFVEALIEAGADVNARSKHDYTPLHFARNKKIAKALTKAGADVNARGLHGYTPLHFAIFRGRKEVVDALIEAGADVNARGMHGYTLLHLVANNRELAIAKALIKAGANVNARDDMGNTSLFFANKEMKKLLIEAGAQTTVMTIFQSIKNLCSRVFQ